jgi:hypothetical protein
VSLRTLASLSLLAIAGCATNGNHGADGGADDNFDAIPVADPQCGGGWLVSNVPRMGTHARFAFGPDGSGHVLYHANPTADAADDQLRHVDERTIAVADVLPVDGNAAIAIAPDGTANVFVAIFGVHIEAYRRTAGAWQSLGPAFGSDTRGTQPFATIDADGRAHVSYSDDVLYYATDDADAKWSFEPVGPQNRVDGAAVDVDPTGHAHLFYGANDPATGGWGGYWTSNATGAWKPTPFPGVLANADAVDNLGRPHLLAGHHHFWYDGGVWQDELLTLDLVVTGMRIDSGGHLHLAGFSTAGEITYATDASGSWTSTTVPTDSIDHPAVWIGLDAGGAPHLAWGRTTGGFAFARRCP